FEKPFRNPRHNQKHNGRKNSKRNYKPDPKQLIQTSLTISDDYSQNNQYRSIGQNSSSNGNRNRLIFGDAQFTHYRISDQRMGCKHTSSQETGIEIISEKIIAHWKSNHYRNYKCQKSKHQAFIFMGFEFVQIQF